MTSITIYDGANTIGGNKIFIEENGKGIFLDFGMNFKEYGVYYQEFLSSRSIRGIYDLFQLNLIPKLNVYRKDLIPLDYNISSFPKLKVEAILLSHAHMDHFGNIGLLNPEYPIICSPTTLMLLKGILDCSTPALGSDVVYYSLKKPKKDGRILETDRTKDLGRDFVLTHTFSDKLKDFMETYLKSRKKLEEGKITQLNNFSLSFDIEPFEVDHSIYGATGFIISGDTSIVYTGDFRLHGKKGKKSEKFIREAKDASILIIEGTRAARKDISESEDIVYENCRRTAELAKGLIIADFSARNFERLETFRKISDGIGRSLVITSRDAYLLSAIENAEGVNRTDDLLVFGELRSTKRNWEDEYLKGKSDIHYVDPKEISKNPENYVLCFSLFDIKNLLDIKPKDGTYIYSSSEAFEEESEFDFVRLYNWLKYFGFKIYGFDIVDDHGNPKPTFNKGFHASGHASRKDLLWAINTIDPETIIPVHTDNPSWFKENVDNALIIKNGETCKL